MPKRELKPPTHQNVLQPTQQKSHQVKKYQIKSSNHPPIKGDGSKSAEITPS